MATAYKLFRLKSGRLYPLYVLANQEVPLGVWLPAQSGERLPSGKVKARLGKGLAFRPGWHCSDIPLATHIGRKDAAGNIVSMHPDTVWAEVEYADKISYMPEAQVNGMRGAKFNPQKACLEHVPEDGFYRYKTSPKMLGEWIISGAICVNRILTDAEVAQICRAHGYEPQRREITA